jgi:hypothetical protein
MITRRLACACGAVALEAEGPPILSVICHCADCREAGRRIAARPGARPVLDAHEGTAMLLFRKDRVRPLAGSGTLEAQRLIPKSPTRRLVAPCCGSGLYLDFGPGHWLSVYRGAVEGEAPPATMRIQAGDAARGLPPPRAHAGFPPVFLFRLLAARLAMALRL